MGRKITETKSIGLGFEWPPYRNAPRKHKNQENRNREEKTQREDIYPLLLWEE
jgi:hypothetical protein